MTEAALSPMVGAQSHRAGPQDRGSQQRQIGNLFLARTPFAAPEAHIVVSSDGYFDVYPIGARSDGDKPAYRGRLAEFGGAIRGADDRLAVRPDSAALALAVSTWSSAHGAAAVRGELGAGRDGNEAAA